jgi:hypothetical protein
VRSALNLSAIFRAIGVREPRASLDLVEVAQPTLVMGDYRRLGPPIMPPTSIVGGRSLAVAFSHGWFHLFPPPSGAWVTFHGGISSQAGIFQPNLAYVYRNVPLGSEVAEVTGRDLIPTQAAPQPSRATARMGTSGVPADLDDHPTAVSVGSSAPIGEIFVPGGFVFEAVTQLFSEEIWIEAIVQDAAVDPLPDAATATTP